MIRSRWYLGLAAIAGINVAAGIWMSTREPNFVDMQTVARWSAWWAAGINPYTSDNVDYPPWALVLLWPLAAVPTAWRTEIWVTFNLGLATVLLVRLTAFGREPAPMRVMLVLLMAAAACVRTLSQFSLLSYTLAVIGASAASRTFGGIALGASLIKPQIGGVAFLWTILRGDWRRAAVALTIPMAALAAYAAVAGIDPATLAADYRHVLWSIYAVPTIAPGHTDLRIWLWQAWPDPAANLWLTGFTAGILVLPAVAAARHPERLTTDRQIELLALCGVVSLLVTRHLSYDFILLLPALVAWRVPPFASEAHAPRWLFSSLAGLLIIAVPAWSRMAARLGAPSVFGVMTEVDRIMCLGVWAALSWRLNRR